MVDLDDPYWWTQDNPVTTLTFVEDTSPDAVADALTGISGEDRCRLEDFDPAAIEIVQGRAMHRVQVAQQARWTVLVEPYGFAGAHEPLVPRLSGGGRHVALYRSVNAVMRFLHAFDGVVTRRFDPLLFPDEQRGSPLPEEAGLVFGWDEEEYLAGRPRDPLRQAVTLAERLTGLELTSHWLFEIPRPLYLVPADVSVIERS